MLEITLGGIDRAWHSFERPDDLGDEAWPLEGVRVELLNLSPKEISAVSLPYLKETRKGKRKITEFTNETGLNAAHELIRRVWKDVEGLPIRREDGAAVSFSEMLVTEDGIEKVSEELMQRLPGILYNSLITLVQAVTSGLTEEQTDDAVFTADSPPLNSNVEATSPSALADVE